ncbi:hypothetical protein GCM10027570_29810 [Streptomonospora sediminis]
MEIPLGPWTEPATSVEHLGYGWPVQSGEGCTLPKEVREMLGLHTPNAIVEVVAREGCIILLPRVAVHPDDAWFWEEGRQQAEREVDAEIAASGVGPGMTAEEFLDRLERLSHCNPEEGL